MSPFPYCRVAQSLVCSHMDDMVGKLVVPFKFGWCYTELPHSWIFSPSMLAELNFLIILHLCDIAKVQNPLYDHTYALLLCVAMHFIFLWELWTSVLSIKPMVIILKLLLIPLPFMLLPLIWVLTIWVFLFMISANALKFMKLRVDLISVELCCILVDHW